MKQVASSAGTSIGAVRIRRAQAYQGGRPPVPLIAAALFAAMLVLLPVAFTIVQAAGVSAQDAVDLLLRPLVGRLLVNTIGLVVAASLTSATSARRLHGLLNGRISQGGKSGPFSPPRLWPSHPS